MWVILTRFLTSRFSGWLGILGIVATLLLGGLSTKLVYDYKELQRKAAYCEGQQSVMEHARAYQDTIIKSLKRESQEQKDEIKKLEGCASTDVDGVVIDSLQPDTDAG